MLLSKAFPSIARILEDEERVLHVKEELTLFDNEMNRQDAGRDAKSPVNLLFLKKKSLQFVRVLKSSICIVKGTLLLLKPRVLKERV